MASKESKPTIAFFVGKKETLNPNSSQFKKFNKKLKQNYNV